MSSRFIVIGSNSFSGSNFIHHILKKKHKVLGLSRSKEINSIFLPYKNVNKNKNFKFLQMDLNYQLDRITKLMHDFKPEYIIFYLGINDRTLGDQMDERMFDLHIQEKRIDRFKDYIKNNSFIYERYKTIANKYFPKQTSGYFLNNEQY